MRLDSLEDLDQMVLVLGRSVLGNGSSDHAGELDMSVLKDGG